MCVCLQVVGLIVFFNTIDVLRSLLVACSGGFVQMAVFVGMKGRKTFDFENSGSPMMWILTAAEMPVSVFSRNEFSRLLQNDRCV